MSLFDHSVESFLVTMNRAGRRCLVCDLIHNHWVVLIVARASCIKTLMLLVHLAFLGLGCLTTEVLDGVHVDLCIGLRLGNHSNGLIMCMFPGTICCAFNLDIGCELGVFLYFHLLVLLVLLVPDCRWRSQVDSALFWATGLIGIDDHAWICSMLHITAAMVASRLQRSRVLLTMHRPTGFQTRWRMDSLRVERGCLPRVHLLLEKWILRGNCRLARYRIR